MVDILGIQAMRFMVAISFLFALTIRTYADPPVLSDEPDTFLLTSEMSKDTVLGTIRQVFPNDKKIIYSLRPPVVGADLRGYIKPEHKDARDYVSIDANTGDVRLKAHPVAYPHAYYAMIRGENEDGYMDQVLIIVAEEKAPTRETALRMFTKKTSVYGVPVIATERVSQKKFEYASKVLAALLAKDQAGSRKITKTLLQNEAMMSLFYDFEERNTAIGFYMQGFNSQDLQDEEIIPDYTKKGGPLNLRRDASVEEITHLIQYGGINSAYPKWLEKLNKLTYQSIDGKFYKPWDGLPEDSFADEYFAIGVAIYYGLHQNQKYFGRPIEEGHQPAFRFVHTNDVPLTKDNLEKYDPELYALIEEVFPKPEVFRSVLGWQ